MTHSNVVPRVDGCLHFSQKSHCGRLRLSLLSWMAASGVFSSSSRLSLCLVERKRLVTISQFQQGHSKDHRLRPASAAKAVEKHELDLRSHGSSACDVGKISLNFRQASDDQPQGAGKMLCDPMESHFRLSYLQCQ
jgi:hypothetical protein